MKRRRKLIDKKFQLRTTLTVISISLVTFLMIIAVFFFGALQNEKHISSRITDLENSIKVENDIVTAFIEFSNRTTNSDFLLASKKISEDHTKSMEVMNSHIDFLKAFIKNNFKLIYIIIGIIILESVFLYFYLITLTHRISGPIFVISRYVEEILDGKEPKFRDLRDKDEFKDFYEKIVKLADMVKKDKEIS